MSAGKERILVAMSGGVDSSVAAALLVEAGHEVVGATMRTFCYASAPRAAHGGKTCCGLDGILDARAVARTLGIPHHVFDVEEEFTRDVIDDFVAEYARGRTPNPCVRCNSHTKFRDLLRRAADLGCTAIASGHYARVVRGPAGVELRRGVDAAKDQAYFLFSLDQDQLAHAVFPVGDLSKDTVREHARRRGLPVADKPDSQEICFVPDDDYAAFVERRSPDALHPGAIVDEAGRHVGGHGGVHRFTVGQRKGLGLSGSPTGEPLYVVALRPATASVSSPASERRDCEGNGGSTSRIVRRIASRLDLRSSPGSNGGRPASSS